MKINARIATATLILTALLAGAGFVYAQRLISEAPHEKVFTAGNKQKIMASLRGFEPGMAVSYEALTQDGKSVVGQKIIGTDGRIEISLPAETGSRGKPIINYSLGLGGGDRQIRMNMATDPATGKTSVTGSGLPQFSDVAIESGAHIAQTKADWSGLFRDFDVSPAGAQYKIALYGNDVQNDGTEHNPMIIEIMQAPGGGGPTNAQVNRYTASNCGPSVPLSVCNSGLMQQQINFIRNNYLAAFMTMTAQFSAIMMQQAGIIGSFFDAEQQLDTARELQQLQAEAHKDYYPSEQMCRFGSFVKSVARTEQKGAFDKQALNGIFLDASANLANRSTSGGFDMDIEARIDQFRKVYCDPADNNSGLGHLCQRNADNPVLETNEPVGGDDARRFNNDIDYARLAAFPMTLNVDFSDNQKTGDEEDVIALARNLYWPRSFNWVSPEQAQKFPADYMDVRQLIAVNSVAHNSFAHIVGMKASLKPEIGEESGPAFMKSMMREFGLSDADITGMLGEFPSYYAQMDVLTKKTYQNPDFYTNLYDKPANIERIGVTMDAVTLMQNRDHFEASLRREMLLSMMVQQELAGRMQTLNGRIASETKNAP